MMLLTKQCVRISYLIIVVTGQFYYNVIEHESIMLLQLEFYITLDGLPGFARIPKRKINQEFKKICDPSRIRTRDFLRCNWIF